ncbi:MAG: hypothetical protein HKN33_08400 [Pyrinomonadaceae bacterium]|nr:hypothetical protein [Pyrinomonadaceae bacterium]
MSLIRIIIADRNTVVSGERHGSDAVRLVASLTAEPETIEELEEAFRRYDREDARAFSWFTREVLTNPLKFPADFQFEPFDAGILAIDLEGKTILSKSTYSNPGPHGIIEVSDRLAEDDTAIPIYYILTDDWKFEDSADSFEVQALSRREKSLDIVDIDAREVLYGETMLGFFVEEMNKSRIPHDENLQSHLHALWLLNELEQLSGKSPRDVLLEKHESISMDMQSRSLQWSFTNDEPLPLDKESRAWKFAGFGTHEIVVYYDLIRHLLDAYSLRLKESGRCESKEGIAFLAEERDKWMETPNPEFSGRKPSMIIEYERRRKNIVMSAQESIVDEDCPICVEMSQVFDSPMFWHLDGSHMDDEFVFSFYRTFEEWRQEQERLEAFARDMESKEFENKEVDTEEFLRILRAGS